jgi:hypothetical protein
MFTLLRGPQATLRGVGLGRYHSRLWPPPGTSEPTVSRRLARARAALQRELSAVFSKYSFGPDEVSDVERNGLGPSPNKEDDAAPDDLAFDEAVGETYARIAQRRAASVGATR